MEKVGKGRRWKEHWGRKGDGGMGKDVNTERKQAGRRLKVKKEGKVNAECRVRRGIAMSQRLQTAALAV